MGVNEEIHKDENGTEYVDYPYEFAGGTLRVIIYDWMKPLMHYGITAYVARILGREGIDNDVLEALDNAYNRGYADGCDPLSTGNNI